MHIGLHPNPLFSVGFPSNEMNILKSQLQQCSHTATSKWVRFNWFVLQIDILALEQKACFPVHRVYKLVITHHFLIACGRAGLCETLTVHSVELTSYIFQQNTIKKHAEDVFIAKILPQGKKQLSKSKMYTFIYTYVNRESLKSSPLEFRMNQDMQSHCISFSFSSTKKWSLLSTPFNYTWLLEKWHFKQYLKHALPHLPVFRSRYWKTPNGKPQPQNKRIYDARTEQGHTCFSGIANSQYKKTK